MEPVPISVALVAGALATLNPCGFPLLPAFLSLYVGAEERTLPRAPNRVAQGLLVGLLVAAGFLAVFAVAALPVTYGVSAVADALPWVGVGIGLVLAGVGLVSVAGRPLALPFAAPVRAGGARGLRPMFLFGIGYGLASVGCTLAVFLAVVGASLGAGGVVDSLVVVGAYGAGVAVVLMALAVAASLAREGLARSLRRIVPYMHRLAGALLVVAGGYLAYYWYRVGFGPSASLADDPLVIAVTRSTAELAALASGRGSVVVVVAALVVAAAAGVAFWQWFNRGRGRIA